MGFMQDARPRQQELGSDEVAAIKLKHSMRKTTTDLTKETQLFIG
jgi:hypothetical protein